MLDLDKIYVGSEHAGPTDQSDFNAYMRKNCNGMRSESDHATCTLSVKFKLASYTTFLNARGIPPETWLLIKARDDVGTFAKHSEILSNDSGLRAAGED
jgi:hypothetical protein